MNAKRLAASGSDSKLHSWLSTKIYAKYWRLHFYAGLLMTPMILWLCITGILYILTPQIESLMYKDLFNVAPAESTAPLEAQLAAARSAYPDLFATAFHPSKAPGQTAYVVMTTMMEAHMTGMRHTGPTENVDVFVNPYTAQVVGALPEEQRYSRVIMNWHGNLYLGEFGRVLTELGTVWALVLVLTGLYLWIPQRSAKIWGVWLPRIKQWKGRIWWRDFHTVGGMYLSILMALFLVTALMITFASGTIFALTRVALRQTTPAAPKGLQSVQIEGKSRITLDQLIPLVQTNGMSQSYMISLPVMEDGLYKISADNGMARPEQRQDITVDQYTGAVMFSTSWKEYPFLTKLTVWGLSFHFGDLLGVTNQVLGVLACLGLIFFTLSGVVMWLKRRPANAWGLPKPVLEGNKPFPRGLMVLMVGLCIWQPMLGVSLLVALGIDWLVQRILARRWQTRPGEVVTK